MFCTFITIHQLGSGLFLRTAVCDCMIIMSAFVSLC